MIKRILITILLVLFLAACDTLLPVQKVEVNITDANTAVAAIKVTKGDTVQSALTQAGIKLNSLDKVDPALSTIIDSSVSITVTRVTEEYQVEEATLPFEQQVVKNESLQEGQKVLIQPGINGKTQTIYRVVYENGIKVSSAFVSSETTVAAQPEIVMIGVQSPFSVQSINGILAYISSGNAWVMAANTGNRRVLTTTGNLDGRVFAISPERDWLLYSTSNEADSTKEINHLWLISLTSDEPKPIDTGIVNVVHYAEWVPARVRTISFSTAEISSSPPFWNADNNLLTVRFDADGNQIDKRTIVDTNSGGLYGWWGTSYRWSPDGEKLAYSRPDSVGLVNLTSGELDPLFQITPYQTESVWAWVPDITWSAQSEYLLASLPDTAESDPLQNTNLTAINVTSRLSFPLIKRCGLFCSAVASSGTNEGNEYVAYLSAILPDQSEVSRYNLSIMDKDGSNQKKLYPDEGVQGVKAQQLFWEPDSSAETSSRVAFIAQGNLFLGDAETGAIRQITGDGSIEKIDWK
jgi:hypothetical protein